MLDHSGGGGPIQPWVPLAVGARPVLDARSPCLGGCTGSALVEEISLTVVEYVADYAVNNGWLDAAVLDPFSRKGSKRVSVPDLPIAPDELCLSVAQCVAEPRVRNASFDRGS